MKKSVLFISGIFLLFTSQNLFSKALWLNSNIDGNLLPEKPRLQDDFYQSVNYDFLKNSTIPDNSAEVGYLSDKAEIINNQMLETIKKGDISNDYERHLLFELYENCLDWDKRNADGIKPVLAVIQKIQNAKTLQDFETLLFDDETKFFLPFGVNYDLNDNTSYIPAFYIKFIFQNNLQAYLDLYTSMFIRCGFSKDETEQLLKQAVEFENQYAQKTGETLVKGKVIIENDFKNLPVMKTFDAFDVSSKTKYGIFLYDSVKKFDALYLQENLEVLKTLSICNLFDKTSLYLDQEAFNLCLDYSEKINGKRPVFSNDEIALKFLNNNTPLLLGKIWIQDYFPEEAKKDIEQLAEQILNEYKVQSQQWTWLSAGTRYNLLYTLEQMKVIVGYSQAFPDYSDLKISNSTQSSLFTNLIEILNYNQKKQAAQTYKQVDPYIWNMSPQTINAYYTTLNNSFNICAGWICSSGYDVTMSYEEKLALIGVTAAHEISHCFSAIGVDGTVTAKWSQKDKDALLKKLNALGNYYSTFEMFPKIYCDGEVCKSEIGADFFGLSNILLIAKNIPDFDYELFFITYAKSWCRKFTEQACQNIFTQDSHPINYLRINAMLQQFDEFYTTFDIKKRDKMYLAPKKRIRIQ